MLKGFEWFVDNEDQISNPMLSIKPHVKTVLGTALVLLTKAIAAFEKH